MCVSQQTTPNESLSELVALVIKLQSLSVITAGNLNGSDSWWLSPNPFEHLIKAMDSHPKKNQNKQKNPTYTNKDKYLKFAWHLRGVTNAPSPLTDSSCFIVLPSPFKYLGSEKNSRLCLSPGLFYGGTTLKDKDTMEGSGRHKRSHVTKW